MKHISMLENRIQEYAWGSRTAIPELMGKAATDTPHAELWMGAHPKAPSMVRCEGKSLSLAEVIETHPQAVLGEKAAEKFHNRLPYLFKVLAAAEPLSIQAHPDKAQAEAGFERENKLNIPLDAPHRNYRDDNHKPECICAITPFHGLNGFRKISDILLLMEKISPRRLEREFDDLLGEPNSQGLKAFFHGLMTMTPERQKDMIANAVVNAKSLWEEDPVFEWILRLHNVYLFDIGVLSPLFLNLVCLDPGQAMYLPAGEPHAYLEGLGMEIMANSDNVLRGGLTPKHVDVPELLEVLTFEEREIELLSPRKISDCESVYDTPAEEFLLSVVSLKKGQTDAAFSNKSAEILLCTEGASVFEEIDSRHSLSVNKGESVIIPAIVGGYRIQGEAEFYKASVPV